MIVFLEPSIHLDCPSFEMAAGPVEAAALEASLKAGMALEYIFRYAATGFSLRCIMQGFIAQ